MKNDELMLKIENVSKIYKLGEIGGTTLRESLQRTKARILKKEDPTIKIGAKKYHKGERFKALDNISFEVKKGERIGIIGHNGAGKSTLLKLISRVTGPSDGNIHLNGRVASMLEVGTGFHPELTGRENIYMNGAILGMTKKEIDTKMEDIIDFSEVRQFIDTPVKRYSSGMYVKLAFSVAAHLDSEIMIMDEVLAVGDASFQKKCINKMKSVSEDEDRTILYVSHNMNTIKELCDKVIVLDHGSLIFEGDVDRGIEIYLKAGIQKQTEYFFDNVPKSKYYSGEMCVVGSKMISHDCSYPVGSHISFNIQTVCNVSIEGARFRFVIKRIDELPILTYHSDAKHYFKDKQYLESFSLDTSLLMPGDYYITIIAFGIDAFGAQIIHDSIKKTLFFSVYDNSDEIRIRWEQRYWGNISLEVEERKLLKELEINQK